MVGSVDPTVPNASILHLDGLASAFEQGGDEVVLVLPRPKTGNAAIDARDRRYSMRYLCYGRRLGAPRFLSFLFHTPYLAGLSLLRRFDLIYIRAGVLSWPLTAVMRLIGRAVIVTEHNGWICDEGRAIGHPTVLQRLERSFQIWDAKLSHVARCVTPGLAIKLAEFGVPEAKLLVAGNGTDLLRFFPIGREEALRAAGLSGDRVHLGFIGNLAPWQGVHTAIAALPEIVAEHPGVRLVIAGGGAERNALEEMAARLDVLDHVAFLGPVSMERANAVVNSFDIALAPFGSERNGAIGLSALKIRDYAAAGRAIVASDIEGVAPPRDRDWIRLCRPDNPHDLAVAVSDLIANAAERARLGSAARLYAERNFPWALVAQSIIQGVSRR